jgi:uncharacterized protein YcsI (UPF0317 family)
MSEIGKGETGRDLRRAARAGLGGVTVGRACGFVQANLFLIPERFVGGFEAFCRANPAACPLLAIGKAGEVSLPTLGADIDVRTDLFSYLVHEPSGPRKTSEVAAWWRDDLTPVAIGCWFGAEASLSAAGVRMRHVELGLQGPLFRTTRPARTAGGFFGPLVVSMRPFANSDIDKVIEITSRLPRSHGAPLHRGDPRELGIADIDQPDWGEPLRPTSVETALFWGCGLTALAALQAARLPFFITHAPGAMLVTDLREEMPS